MIVIMILRGLFGLLGEVCIRREGTNIFPKCKEEFLKGQLPKLAGRRAVKDVVCDRYRCCTLIYQRS